MLEIASLLTDRYRILQVIAQGGQGRVYLAEDIRLSDRRVAVKELLINEQSETRAQAAINFFKSESSMLARLRHPNLPVIYDYFSIAENTYLVMEWIEGETLATILKRSPQGISETQVRNWAAQLGDVLTYLHRQNPPIIFRDLKPANIMLDHQGQIKLIDFGIARVFKEVRGPSQDTIIAGTPGYLPPEQYGNAQTDARSDIYALGVTLLVMLTGIEPGHYGFQLPAVRSLRPDVSTQMEQALQGALRFDPAQRFPSIATFVAAINGRIVQNSDATYIEPVIEQHTRLRPGEQLPTQQPVHAETELPAAVPTRRKTNWAWLALPLGISILACVGILAFGLPVLQSMFNPPTAQAGFAETSVAQTVAAVSSKEVPPTPKKSEPSVPPPVVVNDTNTPVPTVTKQPTATPSETPVPLTAKNGPIVFDAVHGGDEDIYILSPNSNRDEILVSKPGNQQEADISSDGRVVAFNWQVEGNWEIWLVNIDGSNLHRLEVPQPSPRLPAWHPLQPILAYEQGGQLWAIGADGGAPAQLSSGNPHRAPNWSPDGSELVCMTQVDGIWQIAIVNVNNGAERLVTDGAGDKRHPNWSPDGKWLVYNTLLPDGSPDQIWRVPASGGTPEKITHTGKNGRPAFSPDGKVIVFNSDREGGVWLLYTMQPDGGNQQVLTKVGNTQRPDWGTLP